MVQFYTHTQNTTTPALAKPHQLNLSIYCCPVLALFLIPFAPVQMAKQVVSHSSFGDSAGNAGSWL